jgi:hypothetical protein
MPHSYLLFMQALQARPPHETAYFKMLYDRCREGGT